MKHLLRRSLLALFVLAIAVPALPCDYCTPLGWCNYSDNVSTFCIENYDYCTDYYGCSLTADQTTLSDHFTVASVEVAR
jgi:hypothetical protein